MRANNAKTKILATIGPATSSAENLKKLIEAGADAFRLNFSHGSFESFKELFTSIDTVCRDLSMPIPILIDLQGPKIRIGELAEPEIEIFKGDSIVVTTEEVTGTKDKISCSYKELARDADVGNRILIDDGLIQLEVTEVMDRSVKCLVKTDGVLKPRKGMNFPGMKLSVPAITEKDYRNLEFALKYRVDFVALSFVRSPGDIIELKNWLRERDKKVPVIAKIEKPEAVYDFDGILAEADGIMVARGDLGVEMETQEVPIIQKNIIRKCNAEGKLVITATQMLESMIHNPVPTRAEASDVANAVWDGTDVVMLSGETSVGTYPFRTVKMMNTILLTTESQSHLVSHIKYNVPESLPANLFDSTGRAVATIADQIKATVIVVFTHFGNSAKVISKFRPKAPIIAFSDLFDTLNNLNVYHGIYPFFISDFSDEDTAIKRATRLLKYKNLVERGDVVLFTAGSPYRDESTRNWMRFNVV